MKIIKKYFFIRICILFAVALIVLFSSCKDDIPIYDNTPKGNFDALWSIVDERYCFFKYKDVDWNTVKEKYKSRVSGKMSNEALFDLLSEMLNELKDGHVNLFSIHNSSRYSNWKTDYPDNFSISIINNEYLKGESNVAQGFVYKILDNNVGYIYYSSFNRVMSDSTLDYILNKMAICDGLIIDVRNNGGGRLDSVDKIASRFFEERTLVGYISHKKGKGHNDFSELYPRHIEPSTKNLRYQKPIAVLSNRGCYSATNEFVNVMKNSPNVTVVGDYTGGGSGFPLSYELPNGWLLRLSSSPFYNINKEHLEFGISPDVEIHFPVDFISLKRDVIIDKACEILKYKASQNI